MVVFITATTDISQHVYDAQQHMQQKLSMIGYMK